MTPNATLRGVWAAAVTPLAARLDVNHAGFAQHVQWLLDNGCDGVAVFGSTGEANSFSIAERMHAVDVLAASGVDMGRIVVGAGACAYPDVVTVSRHAMDVGCAAVLVTPPFYYKGVSDDGIFRFFARLVEGTGDDIRMMLYHFPRLVQVGFSPSLVSRLVDEWPAAVVAIKDSSGDLQRMRRLTADHPSLSVLAGNERLLLNLVEAGGAGCLTASANLTSRLAAEVLATRDPALQRQLTAVRGALESAPFAPGLKQLLCDDSGEQGWLNIRPPLEALGDEAAAMLREAVVEAGGVPNLGSAGG